MTDIPDGARELANRLRDAENDGTAFPAEQAFARYIASVSEAVKAAEYEMVPDAPLTIAVMRSLKQLILPEPVDPLVEVLSGGEFPEGYDDRCGEQDAAVLRKLLAKRGLEIRPVQS